MKIALSFPGCHERGGVERVVLKHARDLAGRGHDVSVFASEWDRSDGTPGVRYEYVPVRRRPAFLSGPSYFRSCTRRLAGAAHDVVNTHGCVCPTGGVHRVHSVHRAWLETSKAFRAPLSPARLRQLANPLHPVLLRLEERHFRERDYRKVIALTEEVRRDLNRYYGVPAEDVIVLPNGLSPAEFNPERRAADREAMRAMLGLQPQHVALLFVANELERKGYPTVLAAMRQMKTPELRLLVVGRPDVAQVRAQAAAYGLADQVIACGPARGVAPHHAASDLFVLPTQYEAFCMAILEALASGLPVVTTAVPGAQDAIRPGVNGLLTEDPRSGPQLAAALETLLDPSRRAEMSARAPESVTEYHESAVMARYEEILLQNCG